MQRLGGSLALAIVLFNVAALPHFARAKDQWGPWSLTWVFPAGFATWMTLEWLIGSCSRDVALFMLGPGMR